MNQSWVSIWGNAVSISENRPESYGKDITFAYPIHVPFAGNKIRITFDNYCGNEAITISKAMLRINDSFYPISFNNNSSVTINEEAQIVTDEISVDISPKDTLEVRFYFGDYTKLRSSVYVSGPLSKGSYACGDYLETKEFPITISRPTNIVYFLSNVSIYTENTNRAIVCYGDSITAQDWPDYLKLRCLNEGFHNTSIIRKATSGSRILREYDCITYESYGLMGKNRFEHEAPVDGADTIIIQQGINDIIHPVGTDVNPFRPMSDLPTLDELKDGMRYYIDLAHNYGYNVYLGTLLPIEGWRTYADFREKLKNDFNDWIRSCDEVEGYIDFDLAVRNPQNPKAFLETNDSGDHLHPSKKGYEIMANAVPSAILK